MNRSSATALGITCNLVALLALPSFANAIPVQVSNAPEDDLALTISSISSAKKSIFLNIYELSSADIADALSAQVKAGVQVVILEEGAPVGGMSTAAKGIESQLVSEMNKFKGDHFFQMGGKTGPQSGKRRYRFDHAKYAVIDDAFVLIGSENYSPTGNPAAGTLGNRGWEIFVADPTLAQDFKSIFITDSSTQFGDVTDLTSNPPSPLNSPKGVVLQHSSAGGLNADQVTRITSPDTSQTGLLNLINSAKKTIDIEQMTFDSTWNKQAGASPLTAAIIAAAKRNVKVRILLNDEHVFDHPGKPAAPHNTDTISLFAKISNVQAKVANLKAMGVDYIHNKGMLVDGDTTLISSINWDQNSIEQNREAAVSVKSIEVNQYYSALFNKDWLASAPALETEMATVDFIANTLDFTCPTALNVEVNINKFTVRDIDDQDFLSLSGKQISGDFVVDSSVAGCVLVRKGNGRSVRDRLTVELRNRGDTLLFSFEGYTPKSAKLYSVRANVHALTLPKQFSAVLYDASGPSREALGTASIEVNEK